MQRATHNVDVDQGIQKTKSNQVRVSLADQGTPQQIAKHKTKQSSFSHQLRKSPGRRPQVRRHA
jgi:hypothetical protein